MTKIRSRSINMDDCKLLAQYLAVFGVRNRQYSGLEDLHVGTTPTSKTGDYKDVYVVTPYGTIPWNEVSRISDKEMRSLMLSVEKALTAALKAFISFSDEQIKFLPKYVPNERSYDSPAVAAYIKKKGQ